MFDCDYICALKDIYIGYVEQLLHETIKFCKMGEGDLSDGEEPKPLCSAYERPDKATAIQQHKSRFSTT